MVPLLVVRVWLWKVLVGSIVEMARARKGEVL